MKKLLLSILFVLLIAPSAYCADVTISITIPEEFVSRLQAAVGSLNCTVVDENGEIIDTLNAKDCLKRKIVNELKDFVNKYEEKTAEETAQDAYDTIYQDWLNNYVPIPVQ